MQSCFFNFTINCKIEIDVIETDRVFQLSKKDYDKLKSVEII